MEAATQFATLLEAARNGDPSALDELARLYEPQLRTVARRQLGPALRPYLDSTDLVQSVHRSLMVGLREDKFDISTPENMLNLAVTMVRRKVARQWRRLQRQQRFDHGSSPNQLAELLASLGGKDANPEAAAEYNDQLRQLSESLSSEERHWIDLRLQGHSIADIARMQDKDPHWLRVRMSRLRQRLRETNVLTEWL